jgi:protein TonB
MNTTNLHTASFDEIVFEGRNKAYGAFVLRQLYNRHLARALAITVTLCLLLVTTTPPPPVTHRQPVVVTPAADVAPTVVKDAAVTKPMPTTDPSLLNDNILTDTRPGTGEAGPAISTGKVGNDSGTIATAAPAKPFVYAEVMPEFAGGQKALQQYMQRNLRFPRQALAAAVSGKVFVSFTVQADGSISDVQVLKGLGYGTDEEAARVVSSMPSWTPGRQNSRPVAVRYTLPITFQYQ